MVSADTLMSDVILFVRDTLRAHITDPISGSRTVNTKWVFTSYPKERVEYPIITIKGTNMSDEPMGHQSEQHFVKFNIEVRIWARNEKEKNNLTDEVYTYMRENQFPSTTAGTSSNADLHDFGLNSAIEVDDPGEEGIKSRVCEYRYAFVAS